MRTLFSGVYVHAYRKPREVTWLTGVLAFFIVFAFGFSGYLLPWNELAFFATRVGTNMPAVMPGIGDHVVYFMRGGKDVTGATLTRFFGVHVAILPALITALLATHLLLVQYHGMSVPPSEEARARKTGKSAPSMPFVPHFVLRDLFGWTVALALLAGLSAFMPLGARQEGEPVRVRARRHPSGVVLPVDVSGTQIRARHVFRLERRAPGARTGQPRRRSR